MTEAVQRARALLDVPWRHQGRDPAVGLDCVGLIVRALELTEDYTAYGRDPHQGQLEAELQRRFGAALPVEQMQPGDVVAMAFAGPVRHVGLVADSTLGLTLIHTDSNVGKVTEHLIDARWMRRIRGVYRP